MPVGYSLLAYTLLLLITPLTSAVPFPSAAHLPYQAHSFNDLGIVRHLLEAGTRYFKFDASLADETSCQVHSTWERQLPCFASRQYAEPVCCIAMRGDAGSQDNFRYAFNTSDEFVALIEGHLADHHSQIDFLMIAIDAQFGTELADAITERFMAQLAGIMEKYPQVWFSIKGDFVFECDRVCRHGLTQSSQLPQALGQEACTPQRKAISESRFFLQSGGYSPYDPRDLKNRYRNFNTIFKDIDRLCSEGFPTWMDKYPKFPLIFWEPSNEDQIQTSLAKLMEPKCQAKHGRSVDGIAFASNIDPAMFEVFSQSLGADWEQAWEWGRRKMWLEGAERVRLARVKGAGEGQGERLAVYRSKGGKHHLAVLAFRHSKTHLTPFKVVELEREVAELHGLGSKLVVVYRTPEGTTRDFDALIHTYDFSLTHEASQDVPGYVVGCVSGSNLTYVSLVSSNPHYFNVYSVGAGLTAASMVMASVYMPEQQIQSIRALYRQGEVVLVLGDGEAKTWVAQARGGNIVLEREVMYGVNAAVQAVGDGLIVVVENGYCHGGILLNNNAQNKCQMHRYPALEPLAHLPHLLNVASSSLADLLEFMQSDDGEVITACHPRIRLSKLSNGGDSHFALLGGKLVLSTRYVPLSRQELVGVLFSGGSNYGIDGQNRTGFTLSTVSLTGQGQEEASPSAAIVQM